MGQSRPTWRSMFGSKSMSSDSSFVSLTSASGSFAVTELRTWSSFILVVSTLNPVARPIAALTVHDPALDSRRRGVMPVDLYKLNARDEPNVGTGTCCATTDRTKLIGPWEEA